MKKDVMLVLTAFCSATLAIILKHTIFAYFFAAVFFISVIIFIFASVIWCVKAIRDEQD